MIENFLLFCVLWLLFGEIINIKIHSIPTVGLYESRTDQRPIDTSWWWRQLKTRGSKRLLSSKTHPTNSAIAMAFPNHTSWHSCADLTATRLDHMAHQGKTCVLLFFCSPLLLNDTLINIIQEGQPSGLWWRSHVSHYR